MLLAVELITVGAADGVAQTGFVIFRQTGQQAVENILILIHAVSGFTDGPR
jgi:hypothetical protein